MSDKRTSKEESRFMSGVDEVELTDELIEEIKDDLPPEVAREMRELGFKWNKRTKSLVMPGEIL